MSYEKIQKAVKVQEQVLDFLKGHEGKNYFKSYVGKISDAHERGVTAFSRNIDRHQIGSTRKNGQIAHVVLKNENSDTVVARFHEKNTADSSFKDSEKIHPVGKYEYYYPDCSVAAVEIYPDTPENHSLPIDGIYFDPEGNRTTRAMFDVLFRKEHGLERTEEFAPRIKHYNGLINDLAHEYVYATNRFSPDDIRELVLSDKPAAYLDMLAKDVENACEKYIQKGSIYKDGVNHMNRLFVYGETNTHDTDKSIYFDEDILTKLGFDMNCKTTEVLDSSQKSYLENIFKDTDRNMEIRRDIYRSNQKCYDYMLLNIDKDKCGRVIRKEMSREGDAHLKFFYPDGKTCINGDEESRPISFDSYGKLCTFDRATDCFRAEWGLQQKYIDANIVSNGKPARLMNSYDTGFDANILLVEVNGKKMNITDYVTLPKGEHNVRIHIANKENIIIPKKLFENCPNLKQIKFVGIKNQPEKQSKLQNKQEKVKKTEGMRRI